MARSAGRGPYPHPRLGIWRLQRRRGSSRSPITRTGRSAGSRDRAARRPSSHRIPSSTILAAAVLAPLEEEGRT
ncbi:hypothetical protein VPH35_086249 [Triticum aestivum]